MTDFIYAVKNKIQSFYFGTIYTSSSSGPNCARVLVLTSDLSIKEDNCFKISGSDTFGPVIRDITIVPGIDIYYAVGYHVDHIGSENTAFILKYELQTNYVMNVLSYKTVHADWERSGNDGGFVDAHFDRNGTNLVISGIMKDASDKEHILVFSMNRETDKFNWFKYLQQTESSTISVSSRETKSTVAINTSSGDAVIVCSKYNYLNLTDFSTKDYIYIYSLNIADGSLKWDLQFEDYLSKRINTFFIAAHSGFNQAIFMNSNSGNDYYEHI